MISIHAGQCGNQIGSAFWNRLLLEHEKTEDSDPSLSTFFYFDERQRKRCMKARALLVDMECGPLQETMKGGLSSLFDETQYIMDVSGAGNNFAQGYYEYGPAYHEKLSEGIRKNAERCESLQAFSLIHSLGGGTGSGVGTYILRLLSDEFSKATRFSTCVYPSHENDVITSPYNSILATQELIQSADCVFPLNNSSLYSFSQLENQHKSDKSRQSDRGFDQVNMIAARMLCNVTSSSRFSGELNVDLNEIYTNLVPFPRFHFLSSALNLRDAGKHRTDLSQSALQRAFSDILGTRGHLSGTIIQGELTMASAFLGRGKIVLSEFLHCVNSAQQALRFPTWNRNACKIGLCGAPAPGDEFSVLSLYNSSAFSIPLERELRNFQRLFRAKAMLHHYSKYVEENAIFEAESEVEQLISDYRNIEAFPHSDLVKFPLF